MSRKKKIDGLQRLIEFLKFLKSEKIGFAISSKSDVSITVDFGVPGRRFEVDFYPDEMVFAHFSGDESVSTDDKLLNELMSRNGYISGKRPPSNR